MADEKETSSGLTSAMPVIGAGIDAISNIFGGLFNANQAAKNRAFQERMYYRQLLDQRENWRMMNEYNTPSAQLARLREAGLSPLLMYSGNNPGVVATSPADGASAPSGSHGSMSGHTNFGQAMAQAALLRAQIDNIDADTLNKRNDAKLKSNQDEWYHITKDVDLAKKYKDNELLDSTIEYICTQDNCLTNLTAKQMDDITSIIEYREKYFNLDYAKALNQMWYNIEQIALGKIHVNNELKQIALGWYNAKTQRMEVKGKLEVFAKQVLQIAAQTDLTEQEKTNKILDGYNTLLKNQMLENTGTEQLSGAAGLMLLLSGSITGRIDNN